MPDKTVPLVTALRIRIKKSSDATDPFNLESKRVEADERWFVQRVSIENETSNFTGCRIGIARPTGFEPTWEERILTAARVYHDPDPQVLISGERLRAAFAGTSSADTLILFAYGFIRRVHKSAHRETTTVEPEEPES